jgi:hypothetical protein
MAGIAMPVASAAPAAADDLSNVRRSIPVRTILVMMPSLMNSGKPAKVSGETLTAPPKLFDIRTYVRFSMSFNDRLDGVNNSLGHGVHDDAFRTAAR